MQNCDREIQNHKAITLRHYFSLPFTKEIEVHFYEKILANVFQKKTLFSKFFYSGLFCFKYFTCFYMLTNFFESTSLPVYFEIIHAYNFSKKSTEITKMHIFVNVAFSQTVTCSF